MQKVLKLLDDKYEGKQIVKFETVKTDVLDYLYWVKTLCNLIERGIFDFDSIDEIFSFRFFSIVDNKEIQEMEIGKYSELYRPFYRVHKKWTEYRKKHGKINSAYTDEDLSLVPNYSEYSK